MVDPHEYKAELAGKVKRLRIERNLSQVAMAQRLGVARQTYLDLEHGRTHPKLWTLMGVAEIFDVDLLWLIDYKPKVQGMCRGCPTQRYPELVRAIEAFTGKPLTMDDPKQPMQISRIR